MTFLALLLLGVLGTALGQIPTTENYILNIFSKSNLQQISLLVDKIEEADLGQCVDDLWKVGQAVAENKTWALAMLDASAKIQSGILEGHVFDMGSFDECLAVQNDEHTILGKYCLIQTILSNYEIKPEMGGRPKLGAVNPSQLSFVRGVCFPHTCTNQQFDSLLVILQDVTGIGIESKIVPKTCFVGEDYPNFSIWEVFVMVVLGVLIIWIGISTILDLQIPEKDGYKFIRCFSIHRNTQKLLKTTSSPGTIKCLNGIRVISIVWIAVSHRLYITTFIPISINARWLPIWFRGWSFSVFLSGTIAVDTFLFISGFLVVFSLLKHFKTQHEQKKKVGIFTWIFYYVHRYVRLTVALVVVLIFCLTLIRSVGYAPMYRLASEVFVTELCEKNWWSTLIYMQNYINPIDMCMGHSWYLAVDTQLYVLAPILVTLIWRRKDFGYGLIGALIVIAHIVTIWIVLKYEIKTSSSFMITVTEEDVNNYNSFYYSKTHTRAIPWLIGALFSHFYFYAGNRPRRLSKILVTSLWTLSAIFMLLVIFSIHEFVQENFVYYKFWDTTYLVFSKTIWSMALCWIIYACQMGYGGVAAWFLNLNMWIPLSKLTYGVYLVHIIQQLITTINHKTEPHFSLHTAVYLSIGDLVLSFFWATCLHLIFEAPIFNLENMFWKALRGKQANEQESNERC